jgi:hypothetical protein
LTGGPRLLVSKTAAAYRFRRGGLAGWAGFSTWTEQAARPFYIFLNFCFSPFLFDSEIGLKGH